MERQGHVERDVQARRIGQALRTAQQGVDPMGPRHVVVLVVVLMVFRRIDRLGKPGPLQPVARPLAETRVAARLGHILPVGPPKRIARSTRHIPETPAHLHGIGRNQPPGTPRTVRQRHDRLLTRGKRKMAQINPGSTAHRLIDREFGLAAQVVHRIAGIVDTLRGRLVAHVDGIFAPLGDRGPPFGLARRTVRHAPDPACRTLPEGVFTSQVDLPTMGKASTARFPGPLFGIFPFGIVVGQHLVTLHVAFARQQHARPGIFEHRDQVRQHVTLRIEVLAGLPQRRALPPPAVLRLVEIASVALP